MLKAALTMTREATGRWVACMARKPLQGGLHGQGYSLGSGAGLVVGNPYRGILPTNHMPRLVNFVGGLPTNEINDLWQSW